MFKLTLSKERLDTTKPWVTVDTDNRGLSAYTTDEISTTLVPYWNLLSSVPGKRNDTINITVTDTLYTIEILFDSMQAIQEYLNLLQPNSTNPVVLNMLTLLKNKKSDLGLEEYRRTISIVEV